jgi:hypothetical protein
MSLFSYVSRRLPPPRETKKGKTQKKKDFPCQIYCEFKQNAQRVTLLVSVDN